MRGDRPEQLVLIERELPCNFFWWHFPEESLDGERGGRRVKDFWARGVSDGIEESAFLSMIQLFRG